MIGQEKDGLLVRTTLSNFAKTFQWHSAFLHWCNNESGLVQILRFFTLKLCYLSFCVNPIQGLIQIESARTLLQEFLWTDTFLMEVMFKQLHHPNGCISWPAGLPGGRSSSSIIIPVLQLYMVSQKKVCYRKHGAQAQSQTNQNLQIKDLFFTAAFPVTKSGLYLLRPFSPTNWGYLV